jgi:hypothetical protein
MTSAIIELVVSTPAHPEPTVSTVADDITSNAKVADARARYLTNLEQTGWTLLRDPYPRENDGYTDIIIQLTKDFPDGETGETAAEKEFRGAGAPGLVNASLGWNFNGRETSAGFLDVDWWTD